MASKADDARERSPIRSPKRANGSSHKRIKSALASPGKSGKSPKKNLYASVPSKVYKKDWAQI